SVGEAHRFFPMFEGLDDAHRSEDLVAVDAKLWLRSDDHRGRHDATARGATREHAGTRRFGLADPSEHALYVALLDERPHPRLGVERIAHLHALRGLDEAPDELLEELGVDDDALSLDAHLPGVREACFDERWDRALELAAFVDDARRVAAELEQHLLLRRER